MVLLGNNHKANDFDFIVDNSDDVKKWSKKLQKLQPLSRRWRTSS